MTPDDLNAVQGSWVELRRRRAALLAGLIRRFEAGQPSSISPARRAAWLDGAVEELVGLLSVPSRFAARACDLGETWPDPHTAPSFGVEGRAFMGAAGDCLPMWSDHIEAAWRQAWLLLSDVLANEALSPFSDEPQSNERGRHPAARGTRGDGGSTSPA